MRRRRARARDRLRRGRRQEALARGHHRRRRDQRVGHDGGRRQDAARAHEPRRGDGRRRRRRERDRQAPSPFGNPPAPSPHKWSSPFLPRGRLAKAAEKADAAVEKAEAAAAEVAAEMRALQKACNSTGIKQRKLQLHLDAATAQRAALVARRDGAASGTALDADEEARLKELEKQIAAADAKVGKQQAKVDKADAALATLQEQVLAVGGIRLRVQKDKVETLTSRLDGVSHELMKARADVDGMESASAKLLGAASKQGAAVAELEAQIEKAKALMAKLEEDALGVMKTYEAQQQVGARAPHARHLIRAHTHTHPCHAWRAVPTAPQRACAGARGQGGRPRGGGGRVRGVQGGRRQGAHGRGRAVRADRGRGEGGQGERQEGEALGRAAGRAARVGVRQRAPARRDRRGRRRGPERPRRAARPVGVGARRARRR